MSNTSYAAGYDVQMLFVMILNGETAADLSLVAGLRFLEVGLLSSLEG